MEDAADDEGGELTVWHIIYIYNDDGSYIVTNMSLAGVSWEGKATGGAPRGQSVYLSASQSVTLSICQSVTLSRMSIMSLSICNC
jgi:hypothetical protein